MVQGFFILWNTAKQHFTFRLTRHIIPQGCVVVGFVPLAGGELHKLIDKNQIIWFHHTSEVPEFDGDRIVTVDSGKGYIHCMDMDSYINYIWGHLDIVDGYLDTSFMFKALEPVPDTESIPAPEPEVPFQGNQPDDLIVSEDGELVQEI